MISKKQVYRCGICGNTTEVLFAGGGTMVCCGQPMKLQVENTVEASTEKHIPVIQATNSGVLVKVGEVDHPMTEAHYIEWIEIHTEDKVLRKYLKPMDLPIAEFKIDENQVIFARAFCNIHGLWKS